MVYGMDEGPSEGRRRSSAERRENPSESRRKSSENRRRSSEGKEGSDEDESPSKGRRMSGVGDRERRDESSKRLSGSGIEEESERSFQKMNAKNKLFYLFLVFAVIWPCIIIVFLVKAKGDTCTGGQIKIKCEVPCERTCSMPAETCETYCLRRCACPADLPVWDAVGKICISSLQGCLAVPDEL